MPSVQIKKDISLSFQDLMSGVLQLSSPDFESFIKQVQELHQIQQKRGVSEQEIQLIAKIKESLPTTSLDRLAILEEKQQESALTGIEGQEMEALIQEMEQLHFQRIMAIGQLAQLRGESVEQISKDFGFQAIQ